MSRTPSRTIVAAWDRRSRGFTLVELTTVVLIIALLLTILVPTVAQVMAMISAAKTRAVINLIHNACLEYHGETNSYPADGAGLVQALTGRSDDDGKKGFGFRLPDRPRGKVYGPYGGTEKLRAEMHNGLEAFIDDSDQPILYYRCTVGVSPGGQPTYSYAGSLPGQPPNLQNYLKGPGGRFHRTDFVIISRGPDGEWKPLYESSEWTDSDDIANYKRQQ